MTSMSLINELSRHLSLLHLLGLECSETDVFTKPGTLNTSSAPPQTVNQEQCYCVLRTELNSDCVRGWEGRNTELNTAHCRMPDSLPLHSSQSDTQLTRSSSSHKRSHAKAPGIRKNDSQSSLKSWMFEVQPIPYQFTHCEDENMSVYINAYRTSYTYHNMKERLKSSGENRIPLFPNSHPSSGCSSTMVKPKLMVLGEGSQQPCKCARTFRRTCQGYGRTISFEMTDIGTTGILPSKPKCSQYDSTGLQTSATLLGREKGNQSALNRSMSHSNVTAGLLEEQGHNELSKQMKHVKLNHFTDPYSSSAITVDAHGALNAENSKPETDIRWMPKSSPLMALHSIDKDPKMTKIRRTKLSNKKGLHRTQRQAHSKTTLQLSGLGSKSMPTINPNGMATRSEYSHLLRHQPQVSFGNTRPGFRYETLCLQGHSTSNPQSMSVIGPWISTP